MPEAPTFTVAALAEICGGRLTDPTSQADTMIRCPATLDEAGPDAVTWITTETHARSLSDCRAGAIIGTEVLLQGDRRGIITNDPVMAMADVLDRFLVPNEPPPPGVHPAAVVHETATLGPGVAVGACAVIQAEARIAQDTVIHEGVSVGRGVEIGRDCQIFDRCVIYDRCQIGTRVILHAGVVVGGDGFGYIFRQGRHRKFAHVGTVVIEDDVEIGANTCIDRAKLGTTRIGRGSKIDNLVQVAHNVQIGPLCVIIAQCALAGSVRLGSSVVMGGQTGIAHSVRVGDGVRIGAKSVAWSDIPAGLTVSGIPAQANTKELRDRARVRRLPKLFEQVKGLARRVADLEAAANSREHR